MIVTHLNLSDFRNYETADLPLHAGPNLFVGSNGQGKTNLVEAVGYLSSLGSHRVSDDRALVRAGAESAIIRARIDIGERSILAEVQINRTGANRAQINRAAIRTRELPRYFSSVIFAPEDLALVRGEPSGRRRYLDDLLVLLSPRLSGVMADYDRVLRQRNTLLKSARASGFRGGILPTLDVWNDKLVTLGSELIEARSVLVADLAPYVARAYATIAGVDHSATLALELSIAPDSIVDSPVTATWAAGLFRESLVVNRRAEIDRAITLAGPHRDDLVLGLNDLPARGYASHGESWSFALALKLAAAEILRRDAAAGDPVLVLDDVFAELDEGRRGRLAGAISGFEQVLITAAVFGDVPAELAQNAVHIRAGAIVSEADDRG